jgi:periplasmic copper chaperone A
VRPALLAASLLTAPAVFACPGLELSQAWIREAPPGARVMAGYFQARNTGDQALTLDGVSGADFGAAEIHRSAVHDGQTRMLRDQSVTLAPGESAAFEPGGLHLMLWRPLRPLAADEHVDLQLHCGEAGSQHRFTVRAAS